MNHIRLPEPFFAACHPFPRPGRCIYAANREQPPIENSNEMHDIHCAVTVFMAEGHIALAGAMNKG